MEDHIRPYLPADCLHSSLPIDSFLKVSAYCSTNDSIKYFLFRFLGTFCGLTSNLPFPLGSPVWCSQAHSLSLSLFFFLIFIGAQLIYNVVLVSGVQQSESFLHIPTLFLHSFSIQAITEYSVPCATQQVLIICFIYSRVYMSSPTSQFVPAPLIPW